MNAFSDEISGDGGIAKFSTVLDLSQAGEGPLVTYKGVRGAGQTFITIPKGDFEELGQPQQITVSVAPGNTLGSTGDHFPEGEQQPAEEGVEPDDGVGGISATPAEEATAGDTAPAPAPRDGKSR